MPSNLFSNGEIRVFHLVDTLNIGGTENQMVQTAVRLHRLGYRVTVGCLRAEGPLLSVLKTAGIPVVEFRKKKTLMSPGGLVQVFRLALFLRLGKFQVLHAHDLWSNLLGVPAAWLARTPVIISSRRYLADLEWYRPWKDKFLREIYRLSTFIVVNSRAVKTLLVNRYRGLRAEKIHVIYNGVDVDHFAAARTTRERLLPGMANDRQLIAVLANMYSSTKGHSHLISAARSLCLSIPEVMFLMIGDGSERPRLQEQVRDLGLEKHFLFLGRRNDIAELLASCQLAVLPSETESLPNAVLEVMSAGLAVVATSTGGTVEIIDGGVDGLLVPPRSPQSLSAALLQLLLEPQMARRLARAGQEKMRTHFSFDRLIAELEQLYEPPGSISRRPAASIRLST
jgi:glycosyltransferase involved in cell wall biosynthesis